MDRPLAGFGQQPFHRHRFLRDLVDIPGPARHHAHHLDAAPVPRDRPGGTEPRPALVILTGFLGAGKTSLLLEMVEHHRAHDQFVAIIQNEIGATGVDGYIVDGGETSLTLDEGCVCCSLAGSLASGIKRLTERFCPERIILETSGLANPLNLLREQEAWADVARLEMVVTVVDAVHGLDMHSAGQAKPDRKRKGSESGKSISTGISRYW